MALSALFVVVFGGLDGLLLRESLNAVSAYSEVAFDVVVDVLEDGSCL